MNYLDTIFLVLIGVSIIYSLIRGLVREIFSFLSIILGFFGASYGHGVLANWLKGWVGNVTLSQIVGFAILFILIWLSVSLLGKTLSRAVKKTDLRWADRLGGGAFGLLKAILLFSIILLVLTAFLPAKSALLSESKVTPGVFAISRGLSFLVPEKFRSLYAEKEKELKKFWATQELAEGKTTKTEGGKHR